MSSHAIYDVIIGNVPRAKSPHQADSDIHTAAVVTRAQAKLKETTTQFTVPEASPLLTVDKERLEELQNQDRILEKYRHLAEAICKSDDQNSPKYEIKDGILYRLYIHPKMNGGQPVKQVMVPDPLRRQVIELAHQSILGGHLESRRTIDWVCSNFYWPSIRREVTQFCKSCDICRCKDKRGVCGRALLQNMPILNVPFKRVAVDLVGPMSPPSESGYCYILTLVDYTTKYPEAVPLIDIYNRVGVPEKVLRNLGRQFVSDCMKEVSRLLSISQLSISQLSISQLTLRLIIPFATVS